MKIRTDLKAGNRLGRCHRVYNRYGRCKKIVCPYPPYKFPCYRSDLAAESPNFVSDTLESEEPQLLAA